jgi:flagellar basal-body rod protein FlgG
MLDSLYIAATGMHAQQLNVDTISNNLANVNTTAYKRARVSFENTLYREIGRGSPLLGAEAPARFGAGVAVSDTSKIFADGDLRKTDGALDVAIRGPGFFEVLLPDGGRAYTRSGSLRVTRDAVLATSEGHVLLPALNVPPEATDVAIDPSGYVSARVPGDNRPVELGRLDLVRFANPGGLSAVGGNLYLATERSGDALPGKPGEEGFGTLVQGFLESSNVKLVEELIGLVLAQRVFEVNARAVQASDEILGMVNNLRRG